MIEPNYLGIERKRWQLTHEELAHLLGYRCKSAVWRVELGERLPTLLFALGCEVVFGKGVRELFPALYLAVEEAVVGRATTLDASLQGDTSPEADVKRQLLNAMTARADSRHEA